MKRITIYQQKSPVVEVIDDSDMNTDEYCKELSKLFQSSNIAILKTSQSTFIGRPSKINSIILEDLKTDDTKVVSQDPDEHGSEAAEKAGEETKEEIQEDIITDID
jgi:hypothetical protein